MPYTLEQITNAYAAAQAGLQPDAATLTALGQLQARNAAGLLSDAGVLTAIINGADPTTAVANTVYQFFTGKSPTQAGLAYLVNSAANPNDLNDPYYAKFGLENRFINFAANLGVVGEGSAQFARSYGAMGFADFIASIYESIIGFSFASGAGVNVQAAIADIASRRANFTAIAQAAGVFGAGATAAQIDIATKAAAVGYLLGESVKADIGRYAAANNNLMLAIIGNAAAYNIDIVGTYSVQGGGIGQTIPPPPVAQPAGRTLTPTTGTDDLVGGGGADSFAAGDKLDGSIGNDSLTIKSTVGGAFTAPAATVSGIETVTFTGTAGATINAAGWTGLLALNATSVGATQITAPTTASTTLTVTGHGGAAISVDGGMAATVTATGTTTGSIMVGAGTAPTGAVTVTQTQTGAVAPAPMVVMGGSTVSVTQVAVNGQVQANAAVNVLGRAGTTSVTVSSPTYAQPLAVGNTVSIVDVNAGTLLAGTIAAASVSGFTSLTFGGNALTSLVAAFGTGNIQINNAGLAAPTNRTLGLGLNGQVLGSLGDAGVYTTLNLATAGAASTFSNLNMAGLTTLNLSGNQLLTLTSTTGATSLSTVKVSGSAGLTADLSGATVTLVDTTAATGASTVTVDFSKAGFLGGTGVDTVTGTASAASRAISLGGGDDRLTIADGTVPLQAVDGGPGTDTLVMSGAVAAVIYVTKQSNLWMIRTDRPAI